MKKQNILNLSLVLLTVLAAGCVSTKPAAPTHQYQTMAAVTPSYSTVNLNNIPVGLNRTYLTNDGDLRQVVELALSQSDKGKHANAAAVFMQAYEDFGSSNKSLEQALLSAAICEYFQAGMLTETRETLKLLDASRDSVYEKFDDTQSIANIRKVLAIKK